VEFRPRQKAIRCNLILAADKKEGGAKEKPPARPKTRTSSRVRKAERRQRRAVVSRQLSAIS